MSSHKKELNKLESIRQIVDTLGGRSLIEHTLNQCVRSVYKLTNDVETMGEREMIAAITELKANLQMYQHLTGIDASIEAIKQMFMETNTKKEG